jgi:hypothetical protein
MKWVIERDLLIAQALAFVQSVSGKKEDAGKPDAAPDIEAAPIDAIIDDAFKYDSIKRASIKDHSIEDAIKIVERPASIQASSSIPVSRTSVPSDFRTEIQASVANFRAHQERFHRDRDEYYRATFARIRTAIGSDPASPPLRK